MMTTIFILSVLGVLYFIVSTILKIATKKEVAKYEQNPENYAGRYGRKKPALIDLPFYSIVGSLSIVFFVLFIVFNSLIVKISPQDVGLVSTPKGLKKDVLYTGWHFVMPWYDVFDMDRTTWVYTLVDSKSEGQKKTADAIWAPSSEGMKMGFDISLAWSINPSEAAWIYQNLDGEDEKSNEWTISKYHWIEENVIRPEIISTINHIAAKYRPEEIYSEKRKDIEDEIGSVIQKSIKTKYKLIVHKANLRNVYYPKVYEDEIKKTKVQARKVLTEREVTKRIAEQEKQAIKKKNITITNAEAEAEALRIKGNMISRNPKIIQLEWINKWDGQLPTYMMGKDAALLMQISK